MPFDPTNALVEALMPIVFGFVPLELRQRRGITIVTRPPSCISAHR